MASYIGKQLFLDNATALGEKLAFARCFNEESAEESLSAMIVLGMQENFWYIFHCNMIGGLQNVILAACLDMLWLSTQQYRNRFPNKGKNDDRKDSKP